MIEIVNVQVIVHAKLKVNGQEIDVRFRDKGGGKLELAPESEEHQHLLESGILDIETVERALMEHI
jgi:hypothetical protein